MSQKFSVQFLRSHLSSYVTPFSYIPLSVQNPSPWASIPFRAILCSPILYCTAKSQKVNRKMQRNQCKSKQNQLQISIELITRPRQECRTKHSERKSVSLGVAYQMSDSPRVDQASHFWVTQQILPLTSWNLWKRPYHSSYLYCEPPPIDQQSEGVPSILFHSIFLSLSAIKIAHRVYLFTLTLSFPHNFANSHFC